MAFSGQITRLKRLWPVLVCGLCIAVTPSCIREHGVSVAETDPQNWDRSVRVICPVQDTLHSYDLDLLLRYLGALQALSLEIRVTAPDSTYCIDTLHIPASGTTDDDFHEGRWSYRTRARFSQTGDYLLDIKPLEPPLRNFTAVGIILR